MNEKCNFRFRVNLRLIKREREGKFFFLYEEEIKGIVRLNYSIRIIIRIIDASTL